MKDKVRVIRESHLSDNNAEAYFELYARITGNKNQKTLTTILCNCKHGTYTLKAFDGLAESRQKNVETSAPSIKLFKKESLTDENLILKF